MTTAAIPAFRTPQSLAIEWLARCAFTLIELLVALSIVGVLVGLILPAVQMVRAAAQRTQCQNNLKQIGLALHADHDTRRHFPAGCSFRDGTDPQPHMTWMTRLLPQLDYEALWRDAEKAFEQVRFFEGPPHLPILGRPMPPFTCPSDNAAQTAQDYKAFRVAFTDYLGVEGHNLFKRNGILFCDSNVRLGEITDGTANTLLVGERPPSPDRYLGWWYAGWGQLKTGSLDSTLGVREQCVHPRYWSCGRGPYHFELGSATDRCAAFHFWSHHPGGVHFLFADGSVRFLTYPADPLLPALATRAGGEPTPALD
ncbi:MAG: DUF1559 domain-containing protein [Gemmataceae bacterium]